MSSALPSSPVLSCEQAIQAYLPLVRKIAYHLVSRLPDFIHAEDLVQAGVIGLVESYQNYDPSKGAVFATYARIRVRGAMIDELRRGDWAPRSVHRSTRSLNQAIHKLESQSGTPCSLQDLATELNLSIEEVSKIIQDTHGKKILSYDESGVDGDQFSLSLFGSPSSPLDGTLISQQQTVLAECINQLPEREKAVVIFHYHHDYSLKHIAEILNLSESRVSQIMAESVVKLRNIMKEHERVHGGIK
jgi:RNA polymerase sigma factor FliA